MLRLHFMVWAALACLACSDRTPLAAVTASSRVAGTRGSAVVLSRDERIAVATNRTAGVVTVFRLRSGASPADVVDDARTVSLDMGAGSEPWAAVIGADDDTAYVILRGDGVLQRIVDLRGASPRPSGRIALGSEPTAIAISPSGAYLFVANWGDGTISVVRTETFAPLPARLDLNRKLAASGVLGNVEARPGLAHPRALAMTDDGDLDDGDEWLYVTEFFSQPLPNVEEEPDGSHVDRNRQGFVYSIPVSGRNAEGGTDFRLSPVDLTGFPDSEGETTACFPNQLYAAAAAGSRLLVASMCASPRGPVGPRDLSGAATDKNFKTVLHPTLFELDLDHAGNQRAAVVLTSELEATYAGDGPEAPARMPLIPNDIAITEAEPDGALSAYMTAFGADAVFRLDYSGDGSLRGIGSPNARFTDLRDASFGGMLPVGIAVSKRAPAPFSLVLNDNTQNLSVVDRRTEKVVSVHQAAADVARAREVRSSSANTGRRLFATGLDAWSHQGRAWNSCESCHPDGLSDGVTWFFTRGPRRTIAMAGTYDGGEPERRRVLLWTGNVDEIHDVEVIARTVAGGVGGVLWDYSDPPSADCRIVYDGSGCSESSPAGECTLAGTGREPCGTPKRTTTLRNGLNGSLGALVNGLPCSLASETCDNSLLGDWNDIDAYVRSVRAPRRPALGGGPGELAIADVDRGLQLFRRGRCAACHGGPGWTISKVFYTPGPEANGSLPYVAPPTGLLDRIGSLRRTSYRPDPKFPPGLNPPARDGPALLRTWAPVDETEAEAVEFAYAASTQARDQIHCVLRSVGTFPEQPTSTGGEPSQPPKFAGIVPHGAPGVLELRHDMKTLALGESGFNIPSLLGVGAGGPYFHAGNARTLEEVFDPVFRAHHQAIVGDFLENVANREAEVRALVSFLLSIDENTRPEDVPDDLPYDPILCPTTLGQ